MLRCADDSIYTGITTDLERRLKTHNTGKGSKYTRARLPVQVIWSEQVKDESAAKKREAEIKKLSSKEKVLLAKKKTGEPVRTKRASCQCW